jgi:hypothetical protein
MGDEPPVDKCRDASMVYSPKAMRHTLHYHRARFLRWLVEHMPELDTFGRQTAHPLDDKADCLRDYRYHIAIENFIGEHHWTEKLADPFLGLALPFYYGCPNAADYFLPDSFISIDIPEMLSRRAMHLSNPAVALRDAYSKLRGRLLHLPSALSGKA